MKSLLFIIAGVILGLLVIGYGFVERFIYYPPAASYIDSENIIKLPTSDGAIISAVFLPNPNAKFVMLVSHGNAEDIGTLYPFLQKLQEQGFAVLAYDYQGYGTSSGKPGEKQTYADISAAYKYLTETKQYSPDRIIAFGLSVGAAVSLELAIKKPVAGLIMQSPFVSIFRVITRFPILPFDRYNNKAKIKKLHYPLLVIHGEADVIMPIWNGKELYKAYKGEKTAYWVEHAGHNDVAFVGGEKYWQTIQKFADSLE